MSVPPRPQVAPAEPGLPAAPAALADHQIGLEARAQQGDHLAVRTWLRLLSLSTQIEQDIRTRLRERFGITLARFDFLAQLERHPEGLRMSALSRYLMVTGGNVTGLATQLEGEGQVERLPDPEDGRSWRVRLTPAGRAAFAAMAGEHEQWLEQMFDGLPHDQLQALYELLGQTRTHLASA
jgi:DNA-binding MarR family transcriptional regulator